MNAFLKSKHAIISTILILFTINSNIVAQQEIDWNGYLQFRFSDNYSNQTNFSVRRAKFWINGILPINEGKWSYKLQANFLQQVKYQFLLQDLFVNYKINKLDITAGQFVPNFSLQRKQPDYVIPFTERANVVNALVPGAETMARDIGLEAKFNDNKIGQISIGFFNGNGANNFSNQNNFLFINRGVLYLLYNSKSKMQVGYNLSYRNVHNLQFYKIIGNTSLFTGEDFRFGIEEKLNLGNLELQSEYIQVNLGGNTAHGYYVLADYLIDTKNLIAFSVEQLNDLNPSNNDNPWYTFGYSHLIKGNDIKLSLDNKFQFLAKKIKSLTTIQIQYFFN